MANYPEKFTANTIADYVATKNDLAKKEARKILDDFFEVIEAGALSGNKVPLGPFGKLSVKMKPAQPARQGRNPKTGETIQIPPKPETKVPKFSFVKAFKEKCRNS
ncbi:MAG TPA: HU family DNA-binding protein [Spirochaetota bacterium]|nr:HU family DNA-binding protein [Spirochaetota bacterium]